MSQKLPVNSFEWVGELSEFDECFIRNHDENSHKGYILEVDVEYTKYLFNIHSDLPFLPERKKLKIARSLFVTYMTKKAMLYT